MPDITKVAYGLTIGDLKYGNSRPGVVEASLRPGETMEEALDELDDRLNAWHRRKYPHLYQEPTEHFHGLGPIPENQKPEVINLQFERVEIDIDNAATLEELDQIEKDNPVLPGKIIAQLSNKRIKLQTQTL